MVFFFTILDGKSNPNLLFNFFATIINDLMGLPLKIISGEDNNIYLLFDFFTPRFAACPKPLFLFNITFTFLYFFSKYGYKGHYT